MGVTRAVKDTGAYKTERTRPVAFRLRVDLFQQAQAIADADGVPVSWVLRHYIAEGLAAQREASDGEVGTPA